MVTHPRFAAWQARLQEWVDRQYGRRPVIVLILFAVLGIVGVATYYWTDNTALPAIGRALKEGAHQPIGMFGLVFVVLVLLCIGFAFFDTSPNAAVLKEWLARRSKKVEAPPFEPTAPAPPPPLSPQELNAIDHARILWRKVGDRATAQAAALLYQMQVALPATNRFAVLLAYPGQQLAGARERVDGALYDHSVVPLEEVTSRLDRLFRLYLNAAALIQETADSGDQVDDSWTTNYQAWLVAHRQLRSDFTELSLRSDYAALRALAEHKDPVDAS